LNVSEIKPGVKFFDPELTTFPPHYQLHIVQYIVGFNKFVAKHVAKGNNREFELSTDGVAKLVGVREFPLIQADLNGIVGEKVKVGLRDGGMMTGICTAVYYQEFSIDGAKYRSIKAVELDRSGATTYSLEEIRMIVRQGGES